MRCARGAPCGRCERSTACRNASYAVEIKASHNAAVQGYTPPMKKPARLLWVLLIAACTPPQNQLTVIRDMAVHHKDLTTAEDNPDLTDSTGDAPDLTVEPLLPPDLLMTTTHVDLRMHANPPDMTATNMSNVDCNVVAQDCSDPKNPKCTSADDGTMMQIYVPTCVPTFGSVPKDGSCMRQPAVAGDTTGWSTIGMDNCAPGAYCSGYGTLNGNTPSRSCRSFCFSDTDCKTTTEKCMLFDVAEPPGYTSGICVPTCTRFGTDCPAGYNCATTLDDVTDYAATSTMASTSYSCRTPGKVALDGSCPNGDSDCVANAVCFDHTLMGMPGVCTAMCDSTHACPAAKKCTTSVTYPGTGGNPDFVVSYGPNGGGLCL